MAAYREDRRRKRLREDVRTSSTAATPRPSPSRRTSKRTYSDAARHANQPRITDFIPQRPVMLVLCWLLGLVIPAALSMAFFLASGSSSPEPSVPAEPTLQQVAISALSRWWSSVMLLTAAVVCTLIFHLRRYKLDDYRGRYRVWLLMIGILIVGSADAATNLHEVARARLAAAVPGSRLAAIQHGWAPVAAALAGLLYVRIAWEVWSSRGASLVLFLAATSYTIVGLILASVWQPGNAGWRELIVFVALHVGHHELLFALLLYCRAVFRLAQGARGTASTKRRKARAAVEPTSDVEEGETRSESSQPRRDRSPRDADEADQHPTRTELRRQRKEMRRHQRRAA